MNSTNSINSYRSNERGTLVVMLVLLAFSIFLFVSLALDSARFSSSKKEAKMYSRVVALGALEAYMSTPGNLSEEHKLIAARDRARALASSTDVIGTPGGTPFEIKLKSEVYGDRSGIPVLIPGKYFFTLTADEENPCDAGMTPPCFRPIRAGEKPNSMRLEGPLFSEVNTTFGITSSSAKIKPFSDVTVTLLPRRGCFLVDISPSMAYDTHPRESDPRNRFAYFLDGSDGQIGDEKHKYSFSRLPAYRGGHLWTPTTHYQSDYKEYRILNDENFNSTDAEHHPNPNSNPIVYGSPPRAPGKPFYYTVDKYIDGSYQGPEPLRTVFNGLDGAIKKFKERKVGGDKACIIFYDDKLLWHRVFNLTDDFDYLEKVTDWSKRDNTNEGFDFAIQHGVIPRVGASTNVLLALNEASSQFNADKSLGAPTSDFIVLIGDGLSNCRTCNYQNRFGNYCGTSGPSCSNRFDYYYYSGKEAFEFARTSLARQKIPVHVVQTGQAVAPHTYDIFKSGSTSTCLTEFEKRRSTPPQSSIRATSPGQTSPNCPTSFGSDGSQETSCDTDTKWSELFKTASPGNPFYYSAKSLYDLSVVTGGGWYPLRPAGNDCSTCRPGARRVTDPLCRTPATQLGDTISDIMSQSPFTVVEDD